MHLQELIIYHDKEQNERWRDRLKVIVEALGCRLV